MSDEEKKGAPKATEEKSAEEKAPEAPAETKVEENKEKVVTDVAEVKEVKADDAQTEDKKEETPAEEKVAEGEAYKAKLVGTEELKAGMTVRLHEKIKDISPKGEIKERVQVFEGIILGLRGGGNSRTLTIRKVSKGFGVEKIYPINSPVVDKIELVKTAKVRQAKLGYLKNLKKRFKRKLKETHLGK